MKICLLIAQYRKIHNKKQHKINFKQVLFNINCHGLFYLDYKGKTTLHKNNFHVYKHK